MNFLKEASLPYNAGNHSPAGRLLAWYDENHRELPWRISPGHRQSGVQADPYCIWLSEVMLQQTSVTTVKPYYQAFLKRWPTVDSLAEAHLDDVLKAWAGLGYYSRARNMKKAAELIKAAYGGRFPDTAHELRKLPGIGIYSAAAIAAIAFDQPEAVIDGNVERIMTRLHAISQPLPSARKQVRMALEPLVPSHRPGDFAQAMMDLGATVCRPGKPDCTTCPLQNICQGKASGNPELFPVRPSRMIRPVRTGAAFVAIRSDGMILLRKRPMHGLLAGMSEPPNSPWNAREDGGNTDEHAPFTAHWKPAGKVSHVFSHFKVELSVYRAQIEMGFTPPGTWWSPTNRLSREALPSVMRKAIQIALSSTCSSSSKRGLSDEYH